MQVLAGHMSLGVMLGLNAVAVAFLTPLGSLVATGGQLQLLGSYVERIDDVLSAKPEQDRSAPRQPAKLSGHVKLEHVTFRYSPLTNDVVRDVSLEIQPGQFVAIVGRSGSGKSTLAALLVGLYQPTRGLVLYDDVDLRQLDIMSVRRQIGIVNQRPYLFGTSIRANIALADPSLQLADIIAAAKLARIHDEIAAMPMGYETPMLDGGASLSGGQRQRVALARALVRRPAVVLLDEATSALDSVTEAEVQAELAAVGCTRIVIAHRLSTVVDADHIVVVDGGRIVEQGTHRQLLGRGGLYAQLVAAQPA
jgi:ABC-type bacteriocin/lantibiotic exporter with double-glycine peptidase domain